MFFFQTQTPTLTWSSVVADVGHASHLSAAIVATSTVHTAVISQERENISASDEMAPTTRETLCTIVIQRTNVKRQNFRGRTEFFLQTPT